MSDGSDSISIVLAVTSLAALGSAAGVLPYAVRERVPAAWTGGAWALAAGCMLGVAYVLLAAGLAGPAWPVLVGGAAGVGYTRLVHVVSGTAELDALPAGGPGALHGRKLLLQHTLHAASEGVAIGAAAVFDLALGLFFAVALALHNVAEALALAAALCRRPHSPAALAWRTVATNLPQVLLALATFALIRWLPALEPWALGFAAGTLVFLASTELLPFAYRVVPRSGVALVVSLAAGTVVLVRSLLA